MAGQYATVLNPGYSLLWVKDLRYTPGTNEAADLNPFTANDGRPLIEGEWLELAGAAGTQRYTRGGDNNAGTKDEGTVPAFLYFMEPGRTDVQVAALCHCIRGPLGFEIRTRVCDSNGLSIGDPVSVQDINIGGIVRRGLAAVADANTAWVVGRVTRINGTDDINVQVGLQ